MCVKSNTSSNYLQNFFGKILEGNVVQNSMLAEEGLIAMVPCTQGTVVTFWDALHGFCPLCR
jgi:hypothetical protein